MAEPLTPAEQEQCDALYEELKPMATDSARNYVLGRTPARLQEAMTALIDADWPLPPAADPEVLEAQRRERLAYDPQRPDPNPQPVVP